MYIVPDDISRVIWKVSKSEDCSIENLKSQLSDYTGWDWVELGSDKELASLCVSVLSDYCTSGVCTKYGLNDLFYRYIIPDKSLNKLYWGDKEPSLEIKLVYGVLSTIRNSQIKESTGEVLIDYGQYNCCS